MEFKIFVVTGGCKSGKSVFSQRVAESVGERRLFLATAEALDGEMKQRIEEHKRRRKDWDTVEEPLEIARVISEGGHKYDVVLVDCLTLWLSNLLGRYGEAAEGYIDEFVEVCQQSAPSLILVSNEVGMGIVPDNALARLFRDLAGVMNQRIGELADVVVMMIAGVPLFVKGEAGSFWERKMG